MKTRTRPGDWTLALIIGTLAAFLAVIVAVIPLAECPYCQMIPEDSAVWGNLSPCRSCGKDQPGGRVTWLHRWTHPEFSTGPF